MRLSGIICRSIAALALVWIGIASALGGERAPARAASEGCKKIVMIAGPTRHPRGTHEHDLGLRLLKSCLDASPNVRNLKIEVHSNNWPADPRTLDDADTLVLYNEGWDGHLLARPDRRETIRRLMDRGVGLVGLHGATAVSDGAEGDFLNWAGGNKKQVYSQLAFSDGEQAVATTGHPVARGVTAFAVHEEIYYRYMFRPADKRVTPILTAMLPPDKPQKEIIAWALQRADGGRAFMYAGPHFYSSWRVESLRRMVLNAIVWTAKAEVPEGGVRSSLPAIRGDGISVTERRSP